MKQLILISLSLLIIGGIYSCEKNKETNSSELSTLNLSDLLTTYNEGKLPRDHGEIYHGNIALFTVDNKLIIGMESLEEIFILEQIDAEIQVEDIATTNISLLYLHDQIFVVNTKGVLQLLFELDGVAKEKSYTAKYTFNGQGIAKTNEVDYKDFKTIAKNGAISSIVSSDLSAVSCSCYDSSKNNNCDAGGFGAKACSVENSDGECNVSCNEGLFACCNL